MIKGVIFDMDGVIVDTEPLHQQVSGRIAKRYGKEIPQEWHEEFIGASENFVWTTIANRLQIDKSYEELFSEKISVMSTELKKHAKELQYTSTIELIKKLHEKKIPLAIATGSLFDWAEIIVTECKIKELFSAIVTDDMVTHSKPHPEIYLEAAKRLNIDPKECLVFEDTTKGIKAAKNAGMKCVAVTNSFPKETLEKTDADYVVNDLKEFNFDWLK